MQRIKNTQTKDYIAEAIRNEILAGNIAAGEELTQEALAEMLGVSRMPVREALQTLVQEGFVERLPNRHMQAVALSCEQIQETFRLIAMLEAEIASMLLEKESDLGKIYDLIENIKNEKSETNRIQLELRFHTLLVSLLDNKYLEQTYGKLMSGYVSYAIENLGRSEAKADLLNEVQAVMQKNSIPDLKEIFLKYYMYYAGQFISK